MNTELKLTKIELGHMVNNILDGLCRCLRDEIASLNLTEINSRINKKELPELIKETVDTLHRLANNLKRPSTFTFIDETICRIIITRAILDFLNSIERVVLK
jgi:hypothetical protein